MKRVTIKDLAKLLQVSTSTVSRALSNHPDISLAVKQKVKEAAETFNYIPSDFAINFRKKSSKVIGLIIPKLSFFFIPSIIEGISDKLKKENYNFFILSSEESLETEKENILTCVNSRVDGILISLTKNTNSVDHFKVLDNLEIPVVIFDKTVPQNLYDEVVFNSKKTAENCAEKLVNLSCNKILAIFGNEKLRISQDRKAGFLNIMKQNPEINYDILHADSADEAKEKITKILENNCYDGIFAMSDELLAGVNIAIQNLNINIKESGMKIIAISEGFLPKFLNENYIYEKNDGQKMGIVAANLLLNKISNKENQKKQERIYL